MLSQLKSFSKFGVICGSGKEPLRIAKLLSEAGNSVFIIRLLGEADADYSDFTQIDLNIGQLEKMARELVKKGCTEVILSGKINNFSLLKIKPDFTALKILSQKGQMGDNSLLKKVSKFFERKGFNVIPQDKISPRGFLPKGYVFGERPKGRMLEDIKIGINFLEQSSFFDIGQSLVIQSGRIIAVEAVEGTDEMIKRVEKLIDLDNSPAIFIKMAKKNQSLHHDLPVFGLNTIKQLDACNIKFVCLHAINCKLAESLSDIESALLNSGISLCAVDYG